VNRKKQELFRIYQLKVTLRGVRPPIWRRILVPSHITLGELHEVLQNAMGWTNSHLHEFVVGKRSFGPPVMGLEAEDESGVRLDEWLAKPKDQMTYVYDFGDDWQHQVLLEKVLEPEPGVRYPVLVAGKRAAPPEDVGGVFGYAEFLDALADPSHPEHEEYLDWVGDGFDPEAFDVEEANRALEYSRR
jgi:hypothetical protein